MSRLTPPLLEFFFDTSCPWSYLALERVGEAALRTSARVVYRPVLLDQVLGLANPGFPLDRAESLPVKARYQAKDLSDWARYCGLTLRRPQPWPLRAEWAQRGAVVAAEGNRSAPYLAAVFRALFEDNQNINDPSVLRGLAKSTGLEADWFSARLEDPQTLAQVEANGAALVDRGGFGTPTLLVGEDLFFGNDRLPLVEAALARQGGMRLALPGAHGA